MAIDKELLTDLAGEKSFATKIYNNLCEFESLPPRFIESFGGIPGDDSVLNAYRVYKLSEALRTGVAPTHGKGIGPKSAEVVEKYLLKKGLLDLDHRFNHLPDVSNFEWGSEDRFRNWVEIGEVSLGEIRRPIYTVGVKSGSELLYGDECNAHTLEAEALSLAPITAIVQYRTIEQRLS